jgi:hypothetical protein
LSSQRTGEGVVYLLANQILAANLATILATWLAISGRVKWYTWPRKKFSFFLEKVIDGISTMAFGPQHNRVEYVMRIRI